MILRTEIIECPACQRWQAADVEQVPGVPYPVMTHICTCGHVITEREWEPVPAHVLLERVKRVEALCANTCRQRDRAYDDRAKAMLELSQMKAQLASVTK